MFLSTFPKLSSKVLTQSAVTPPTVQRLALHIRTLTSSSSSSSSSVDSDPWSGMNETTRNLATELLRAPEKDEDPWKRRLTLSKAITLVEGSTPWQREQAAFLLTYMLREQKSNATPKQEDFSFRVGLAGPPGAGKSTFVEALGRYILKLSDPDQKEKTEAEKPKKEAKKKIELWRPPRMAVVCIDPSSTLTGGSILGDKTRMLELSRDPRVMIRPAPARGCLGGVAPRTDDVLRLMEAARNQFPLMLVETVGLGQSEIEARELVDMFVLLVPPATGDELQGVKKGIMEVADMVIVTKADGTLLPAARKTARDYMAAMPYVQGRKANMASVQLASSVTGDGLAKVWETICEYRQRLMDEGEFFERRRTQNHYWMWKNLRILVEEETKENSKIRAEAHTLMSRLDNGSVSPWVAASLLLKALKKE